MRDKIKKLAEREGTPPRKLLALSRRRDPFWHGTAADHAKGRWVQEIWDKMGQPWGVHPRRIYYFAGSQPDPRLPGGRPFSWGNKAWTSVKDATVLARTLGYVPFEAIRDRRAPRAEINLHPEGDEYPILPSTSRGAQRLTPADVEVSLSEDLEDLHVVGTLQRDLHTWLPYHLELWVEKSTMHDVLAPLCAKYAINLQEGAGDFSYTRVKELTERVEESDKPARVLYIADCDESGQHMAPAVARKLEFFMRKKELELDIKLKHLALTEQQVREHDLPRTPETMGRGRKWKVELDALEGTRPGLLRRLVEEQVSRYYPPDLYAELAEINSMAAEAIEEYTGTVEEAVAKATAPYRKAIERAVEDLLGDGVELAVDMGVELRELKERLKEIRGWSPSALEVKEDSDDWLFDSQRSYLHQLKHYDGGE